MCQKDLKNGHRLTLKSLFTTHPTMKLFLVSYERYGQINTFLLRYYGTNFASIKRYDQFCLFTVVYKEAQIHPLLTLFILFSCYSFCSHCLPSSPSLCPLSACSLYYLSLSALSLPSLFSLSMPSLCLLSLLSLSLCSLFAFSLFSFASFFIYSLPYSQLFILSLPSLSLFLYSIIELSPSSLLYLCSPSFYLPHVLVFYFFHKNNHVGRQ